MNKYYAKKTVIDGIPFDSKLEAERYMQLKLMEKAGEIACLRLQQEFQICQGYIDPRTGEKIKSSYYFADFTYTDMVNHLLIAEDTKGVETPEFKLKWKLVKIQYPNWNFRKVRKEEM